MRHLNQFVSVCNAISFSKLLLVLAGPVVLGPLIMTIMEERYQAPMHMCVGDIFLTLLVFDPETVTMVVDGL